MVQTCLYTGVSVGVLFSCFQGNPSVTIILLPGALQSYIKGTHSKPLIMFGHRITLLCECLINYYMWQSQVENEHYSTLSGLIQSIECFTELEIAAGHWPISGHFPHLSALWPDIYVQAIKSSHS